MPQKQTSPLHEPVGTIHKTLDMEFISSSSNNTADFIAVKVSNFVKKNCGVFLVSHIEKQIWPSPFLSLTQLAKGASHEGYQVEGMSEAEGVELYSVLRSTSKVLSGCLNHGKVAASLSQLSEMRSR